MGGSTKTREQRTCSRILSSTVVLGQTGNDTPQDPDPLGERGACPPVVPGEAHLHPWRLPFRSCSFVGRRGPTSWSSSFRRRQEKARGLPSRPQHPNTGRGGSTLSQEYRDGLEGSERDNRGRNTSVSFKNDPQTGVALGSSPGPQCAFEMSMLMCPAVHTTTRSLLRLSSTHEPSDPPLRVVISVCFCS